MFLLALVAGVTVQETTLGTTLGNLGFQEVKFPKPTFHGDTIRVRTEIVNARLSKSRDDSGIVTFKHIGLNQRDEIVCEAVRVGLMLLRPKQ
jgi:acyl dehydratase